MISDQNSWSFFVYFQKCVSIRPAYNFRTENRHYHLSELLIKMFHENNDGMFHVPSHRLKNAKFATLAILVLKTDNFERHKIQKQPDLLCLSYETPFSHPLPFPGIEFSAVDVSGAIPSYAAVGLIPFAGLPSYLVTVLYMVLGTAVSQ